jgi:hypothetical protein
MMNIKENARFVENFVGENYVELVLQVEGEYQLRE